MKKVPHSRLVKTGKILFETQEIPCVIRNISKIGACLVVETTSGIPADFQFVMGKQVRQNCKVLWRDDTALGVHFRRA
jgi:hypothetical protein